MEFPYMKTFLVLKCLLYFCETLLDSKFQDSLPEHHFISEINQEDLREYQTYRLHRSKLNSVYRTLTTMIVIMMLSCGFLPWFWKISGDFLQIVLDFLLYERLNSNDETLHSIVFGAGYFTLWQIIDWLYLGYVLAVTTYPKNRPGQIKGKGREQQFKSLFPVTSGIPYIDSEVDPRQIYKNFLRSICLYTFFELPLLALIIYGIQEGGWYLPLGLWGITFAISVMKIPMTPHHVPNPQHEHDELEGDLAQELGHWKLNHELYSFIATQILIFLQFGGYTFLSNSKDVFTSFGFEAQPAVIALVIFEMVMAPIVRVFVKKLKLSHFKEYPSEEISVTQPSTIEFFLFQVKKTCEKEDARIKDLLEENQTDMKIKISPVAGTQRERFGNCDSSLEGLREFVVKRESIAGGRRVGALKSGHEDGILTVKTIEVQGKVLGVIVVTKETGVQGKIVIKVVASQAVLRYMGLDGEIGCIVNGAGIGIVDITKLQSLTRPNLIDVHENGFDNQVVLSPVAENSRGSTVVVMILDDVILLGSDTRVNVVNFLTGRRKKRYQRKTHYLGKGVHIARFGLSEITLRVGDALQQQVVTPKTKKATKFGVKSRAVLKFFKRCRVAKVTRNPRTRKWEHVESGIILAGWEDVRRLPVPRAFCITARGSSDISDKQYVCEGSGGRYANRYIRRHGRSLASMSEDEARQLMVRSILHACINDDNSGGEVRVVAIKPKCHKEYTYDGYE